MSATAPAKICIHCGQDCSGKPRTKDAQGRYACKDCHERAMAAAKAAAQAPPQRVARPAAPPVQQQEEDALYGLQGLEDLGIGSGSKMCSGCGAPMASDAAICVACGLNQVTGQHLGTSTLKPPKVKKERKARASGGGVGLNPTMVGLGLTILFALLMFPAVGSPEMFLLYALVFVLVGLPTAIGTIVCAFKDGFTGWGVVGILQFFVPCLGLAMLYFIFCINQRPMIKALNLAVLLGTVGYVIAAMQHGGLEAIANG